MLCKHCKLEGEGTYCSNCGEIYKPGRITISSILHEVVHTFTHADKGLLYTLKNLAVHPGTMQKNYLEGERKTNQKPFSLFFICASVTAIALHFVNSAPHTNYTAFDVAKENFYKNYYVIMQAVLIPFYSLITWIIFGSKRLNYAEVLVLLIYTLSFSLLLIIPINLVGLLLNPGYEQYAELIALAFYMIVTNFNFFNSQNHWVVVLKTIVILFTSYFTSYFIANQVINFIM